MDYDTWLALKPHSFLEWGIQLAFVWAICGLCKLMTHCGVPIYTTVWIVIGGFLTVLVFLHPICDFLDKVSPLS
jgi:hypothetical protein